jgi:hypothetical protein
MRVLLTMVNVGKQWVSNIMRVGLYGALFVQHAKSMRRILPHVACMTVTHFSTLSHKRHDFRRGGGGGGFCILY